MHMQTRDATQPHVEAAWAKTVEASNSARSMATAHSRRLYARAHPHLAAAQAYLANLLQRIQVLWLHGQPPTCAISILPACFKPRSCAEPQSPGNWALRV